MDRLVISGAAGRAALVLLTDWEQLGAAHVSERSSPLKAAKQGNRGWSLSGR